MISTTRTDLMPTLTVDGTQEKDINVNGWLDFEVKRPLTTYTVREFDIQRPDNLALRVYGNVFYWWIIMKFNDICDPWNDLYVGQTLNLPNIMDIQSYLSK